MSHRWYEQLDPHSRSDCCFHWFVTTREGIDVGPYTSKESAEAASVELATLLAGVDDPETARTFIREFSERRGREPLLVDASQPHL